MTNYSNPFPIGAHAISSTRDDPTDTFPPILDPQSSHLHWPPLLNRPHPVYHHHSNNGTLEPPVFDNGALTSASTSPRPPTPASEVGSTMHNNHPDESQCHLSNKGKVHVNYATPYSQDGTPPMRHPSYSATPVPTVTHNTFSHSSAYSHSHSQSQPHNHPLTPPSCVPILPKSTTETVPTSTSGPLEQSTFECSVSGTALATPPSRLSAPSTWPSYGVSSTRDLPQPHPDQLQTQSQRFHTGYQINPIREYKYGYDYEFGDPYGTHHQGGMYEYGGGYTHPCQQIESGKWDQAAWYNYHQHNEQREQEIMRVRKHVCPVCDKRFNRPSSLSTHMSVHTGAKPYQCMREGCGRRFSVSSNLRRHERTHEARLKKEDDFSRGTMSYQTYLSTPPMTSGNIVGLTSGDSDVHSVSMTGHGTSATNTTVATNPTASSNSSHARTIATQNGYTGLNATGPPPLAKFQPPAQSAAAPYDYAWMKEGLKQYAIISSTAAVQIQDQGQGSTVTSNDNDTDTSSHTSPQYFASSIRQHRPSTLHSFQQESDHSPALPHGHLSYHDGSHARNSHNTSHANGNEYLMSTSSVGSIPIHRHVNSPNIRAPRSFMIGSV